MADKQLGIEVTGTVEDILSKLDEVIGKIQDIPDRDINLGVNVDDGGLTQLTTSADEAASHVETIGDSAANASTDIAGTLGDSSSANSSILGIGSTAKEASSDITGIGQASADAGEQISLNMNEAALTIAAVGAAAELSSQEIYDMSQDSYQLSEYTGIADDSMKKMETTLSSASFPIESVDSYLTILTQLGVSNDGLEKNAAALNNIVLGTGSAAEEGNKFATSIKVLGGDVSNLTDYYGMAAYAQKNVVGGLAGFDSIARTLGPKLKEMGLSAEESAVVIGKLSQKYAGNVRQMRGAINNADGDVNKLYKTLGLTKGEVDNSVASFDSYEETLTDTAESAKGAHTIFEQIWAVLKDIGLEAGFTGANLLSLLSVFLAVTMGPFLFAKALDKLGITTNASTRYMEFLKNSVSKSGDVFKSTGSKIWETIRSWAGWGSQASKAGEDVASGISRASPKAEQSGIKLGESTVKGISKGFNRPQLLDEAGKVLWTDTDDIIRSVGTRAEPVAGEIGESIPKSLVSGITKASTRAVGDIALVATTMIDSLANYTESLKDPLKFAFGDLANVIPEDIRGIFSGYNVMKILVGENAADEYMHWAKVTLEDPMKRAIDQTWRDVTGWIGGLTGNTSQQINQSAEMTGVVIKGVADASKLATELAANKMSEANQRAAQETAAAWQEAYDRVSQMADNAASRMDSMASAMGVSLPSKKYSKFELLQQRSDTIDALRRKRQMIYEGGASKYNSQNEYLAALSDIDKTIAQYESPQYLNSILNSGKSVGQSFGAGLASGISDSKNKINNAVGFVTGGLQAHSPPHEGPLQEIDKWGENIGQTFIESMRDGISSISNILNVTQPAPLPSSTALGGGSGGLNVSFGDVIIPEGGDAKQIGRDLASGIHEGLAGRLVGQANNAGVSTINSMR